MRLAGFLEPPRKSQAATAIAMTAIAAAAQTQGRRVGRTAGWCPASVPESDSSFSSSSVYLQIGHVLESGVPDPSAGSG